MKREIRITEDGSHTLYLPGLDEPYHSIHGAIQESRHVFLGQGLKTLDYSPISILEIGFGTGLNAILTLAEAGLNGIKILYHAIEKYPLESVEYKQLNFERFIEALEPGSLVKLHESPWGTPVEITETFTLLKEQCDFLEMQARGPYDLVYFDAFAPQKQPHLWTESIFNSISRAVQPGGVLVTYTSKGSVRRALISCGFDVKKVPGPPGKREMIRATKI